MIHYLLYMQFAFLYSAGTIIGLVVYGSNFEVGSVWSTGWLYLFPVIVLPTLHKWINPFITRVLTLKRPPKWPPLLLAAGAIVGVLAYKPMHFYYWDEHSSLQALTVSLLGVFSYLASVYGASCVEQWQGKHSTAGIGALLILGLIWACALMFPMVPLFGVSLIMAIAILWPVKWSENTRPSNLAENFPVNIFSGYMLFLLMLDLSLIVWDFQIDRQWATYFASVFLMAALSYYILSKRMTYNNRVWIYALVLVAIINMIAGVVWPMWLLQLPHAAIDGLLFGVLCRYFFIPQPTENPAHRMSVAAVAVVWGMVFGYLFYSNLAYVQWRLVFLLPYILLVTFLLKRQANNKKINT